MILFLLVLLAPGPTSAPTIVEIDYAQPRTRWKLAIAADTVSYYPDGKRVSSSPSVLKHVRYILQCEGFESLPSEIGQSLAIDAPQRTIVVTDPRSRRRVTIVGDTAPAVSAQTRQQMEKALGRPFDPAEEFNRAVRIWCGIESLRPAARGQDEATTDDPLCTKRKKSRRGA